MEEKTMVNSKVTEQELEEIKAKLRSANWPDPVEQRYRDKIDSPLTAIRAMCVVCMCGQLKEVNKCTVLNCPLYPFRTGKNPFHGRKQHGEEKIKKQKNA